ncbi:unnamed protein product [Leptosia nina]|uniref:Uncharacterized protein n=1 Tax=Leptosia nina TaxID=320188 RepID=A0AAV1IZ70_9NEOP
MNITASYSSEHSWSRRCSTETIFSIQGKETDFVRDTSDTEFGSDADREFEPVTEPEVEGLLSGASSGHSDSEIISTKVIEVSVGDDGELQLADSEETTNDGSDTEIDLHDYWLCAQCRAENNNPLYRYCQKCFKVRKDFFPPRPKRKTRRHNRFETNTSRPRSQQSDSAPEPAPDSLPEPPSRADQANAPERVPRTLSQDSGVESAFNSQELSQDTAKSDSLNVILGRKLKRRAESADRNEKRVKIGYSESDSDSDTDKSDEVKPIVKTVSDPALTVDSIDVALSKKALVNTLKEKLEAKDDLCIVCYSEPKSGVFVHGRIAHICCCYKCAVKVWAKAKRCPICNCKVSNVLKAVVM